MRPDKKVRDDLLRPSGALGNYGARVQLAYLLGWIGDDVYKDLIAISKIRNRFAHSIEVRDFSDPKIASWLNGLRGSVLLPDMIKSTKAQATSEVPRSERTQPRRISANGKLVILEGMADMPQSRFRWCIDLTVHALEDCERNMKMNLENLPGNWLPAEEVGRQQTFRDEQKR